MFRLFTSSWMNVLLLTIPFGWLAYFLQWNAMAIFVLVGSPSTHEAVASIRTQNIVLRRSICQHTWIEYL